MVVRVILMGFLVHSGFAASGSQAVRNVDQPLLSALSPKPACARNPP